MYTEMKELPDLEQCLPEVKETYEGICLLSPKTNDGAAADMLPKTAAGAPSKGAVMLVNGKAAADVPPALLSKPIKDVKEYISSRSRDHGQLFTRELGVRVDLFPLREEGNQTSKVNFDEVAGRASLGGVLAEALWTVTVPLPGCSRRSRSRCFKQSGSRCFKRSGSRCS